MGSAVIVVVHPGPERSGSGERAASRWTTLDLGLPPVSESFDIGDLGLVTGFLDLNPLVPHEPTTAVVHRNSQVPIPEPGTGALLLLGLAGLAARRATMR